MRLQQLRYFVAAVEEGSLSRAARAANVAQPALSQQIKNLEAVLGVDVLERSPTGVTATPAGTTLLEHSKHIIASLERARLDVISSASEIRGEVALALPRMVSALISPTLLARSHQAHPNLEIRIIEGNTLRVHDLVQNARVDIGIVPSSSLSKKMESCARLEQDVFLVGAMSNVHGIPATDAPVAFAEAVAYPLTLLKRPHSLRLEIESLAEEQGLTVNTIMETPSGAINRHFVNGGLALSILPLHSFKEQYQLGKVFARRIVEPAMTRKYEACWPVARPLNRVSQATSDLLRDVLNDLG